MNRRVGQLGLGWVESSEGNQGESLKLSLVAHSCLQREELVGLRGCCRTQALSFLKVGVEEDHVKGNRGPLPVWAI